MQHNFRMLSCGTLHIPVMVLTYSSVLNFGLGRKCLFRFAVTREVLQHSKMRESAEVLI